MQSIILQEDKKRKIKIQCLFMLWKTRDTIFILLKCFRIIYHLTSAVYLDIFIETFQSSLKYMNMMLKLKDFMLCPSSWFRDYYQIHLFPVRAFTKLKNKREHKREILFHAQDNSTTLFFFCKWSMLVDTVLITRIMY